MPEQTIDLRQIETPKGLPHYGGNRAYFKDDNQLYIIDADGNEHQAGVAPGLTTAERDALTRTDHLTVFDTTLGQPIWSDGMGGWVDATGASV